MAEGLKAAEQGDASRPAGDRGGGDPGDQGDLTAFVPDRVLRAYRRRRAAWSRTDTVAAWLVAAHLLLLLVLVGRGSLFIDDLRAQGYALDQPFLEFILGSNGTHFAPVPRVVDWLQSRLFPLQHGPAVAVTLVVRLLLAVGFWRVLRRLFGPRPAVLVPFTILLLTPALLPATTYYRQSITVVACTVAIVWAVDAHLRWVLYRHWSDLVVLAVATALGVGCYEKAAAIPVILLAVTLTVFAGRPGQPGQPGRPGQPGQPGRPESLDRAAPHRGAPAPVRAGLVAVLVSGVIVLLFLVVYRSGPYDQGSADLPSVLDILGLTGDTVTKTVIPLLLGGPYQWFYSSPYVGEPVLSRTAVAFCLVIALLGVAAALWRGPGRTVRAALLLIAWTLPSVTIVAAGRFDTLGPSLATTVRLWADLVPGFLLAAALAALPWRVGVHAEAPRPPAPAAPVADPATVTPIEITVPALAGGLVVLLVLGGSMVSSLTYASKWWDNPTGLWVANARLSLENAEPYPRTLATPLPVTVMPAFVSMVFPSDAPLLLLLRPDIRFHDGDGPTKVMDASGVRSDYLPNVVAELDTENICLARIPIGDTPVTVPFPEPVAYALGAQVEVGLLLDEPAKVDVKVTTSDGKVLTPQRFSNDELSAGGHTLRVPAPYLKSIRSITVQMVATEPNSCVAFTKVWVPLS